MPVDGGVGAGLFGVAGPVHACWFCAGPEHFAAVAAPVASAALEDGRAVCVLAPAAFLGAFYASFGRRDARRLTALDSARAGAPELSEAAALLSDPVLVVHAVDAAVGVAPAAGGRRLDGIEDLLEELTALRRAACLCAYDLSAVEAWSADAAAERHHRHVFRGGRLVPFSEALRPAGPVESLPREPAR